METALDSKPRILVVDDDATVRETIEAVLVDEGFDVLTAADGHEAVARVVRGRPQLVLLDVWMPEMDGIEVLARIKDVSADLPVIVLSGHGNVDMAVKATRLGAADFIEKPFSVDALLSSVNRALARGATHARPEVAASTAGVRVCRSGDAPSVPERTLARSVVSSGLGLHSGVRTGLILHPLGAGSGIRFGRVGGEGYIEAHVDNVDSTGYATTLYKGGLVARTVEHLMATLHAYGVTNLLVKVEGEVPILDGSAAELCRLVESVGIEDQPAEMPVLEISEQIRIDPGPDQFLAITPYEGFRITYELSYPEPVGDQVYTFEMTGPEAFREQIAPARTFGFVDEIRQLEAAGLGQGGQLGNFILIGDQGIVNTTLRFPEELARHKVLDLMGDSYLLGCPLRGAIHARKTGHAHNIALLRAIRDRLAS